MLLGLFAPFLKTRPIGYFFRDYGVIESKNFLLINQYILPPRFMLQFLDFMNQLLVMREKRRLRNILTRHQCRADENLTRFPGINRTVMDWPFGDNDQAIQRHALISDHLRLFLFPMRIKMMFLA